MYHLSPTDLAAEVLAEERRLELRGLWSESIEHLRQLDISVEELTTLNKVQWKRRMKEAVREDIRVAILEEMKSLKKLE